VVKDIGYDQDGFSYYGADVEVLLHGPVARHRHGRRRQAEKSGP